MYQINTLYTLNLHNAVCQLCLNKAGKQDKNIKTISIKFMIYFEINRHDRILILKNISFKSSCPLLSTI